MALESKTANRVAEAKRSIFSLHGWPNIFQRDNGSEFRGTVETLFRRKNVKVVKGRPYHPQTQDKVERQNRIIRRKIQHESNRKGWKEVTLAEKLQNIVNSINR